MFQHLFFLRHKDQTMFWTFNRFWNSLSCWHQKVGGLRYLHRIVSCWQPGGPVWPTGPEVDPSIPFHWISFRLCWWLSCGESYADGTDCQLGELSVDSDIYRLTNCDSFHFLGHQWHHPLKTVPFACRNEPSNKIPWSFLDQIWTCQDADLWRDF